MTLPFLPKFSIGDKVFNASITTTAARHECPDCNGTRVWRITSPRGEELEMDCPRCTRNASHDGLDLSYTKVVVSVQELTIGSIRLDTADQERAIMYMCVETGIGSGRIYREDQLQAERAAAEAEAEELRANQQTQIDAQPLTKLSNARSRLGFFSAALYAAREQAKREAREALAPQIDSEMPTSTGITKGAWVAHVSCDRDDGVVRWEISAYDVIANESKQLASGYGGLSEHFASRGEGKANALMMAAAPRLFRALEIARDHLDMGKLQISHARDAQLISEALDAADPDDNVRIES